MKHPEITEWADYARGVATTAERAALTGHLDEGCRLCQTTVSALERVAETAGTELQIPVPAGAVRSVNAFFATQHPKTHGLWAEPRLRTVFDSALEPMASGSRSQTADSRHLLFESDSYTVELDLDFPAGAMEAVLRGQILEARGEPSSHTPVFLIGDGTVIGRAISEEQGTFELSGRLRQPCELWVFPDEENRIRLTLGSEQ